MKKNTYWLILAVFICCLSCQRNFDPKDSINPFLFNFYILDEKSGKNLISKSGQPYHPDTIKIINLDFPDFSGGYSDLDHNKEYFFRNVQYQISNKFDDNFHLYLNKSDIDTLKLINTRNNKFEFYHNGKLIYSFIPSNENVPTLNIKK